MKIHSINIITYAFNNASHSISVPPFTLKKHLYCLTYRRAYTEGSNSVVTRNRRILSTCKCTFFEQVSTNLQSTLFYYYLIISVKFLALDRAFFSKKKYSLIFLPVVGFVLNT